MLEPGGDVPEESLGAYARKPGHADDDAWEDLERIGVQAVPPPYLRHQCRIDNREVESELL